ncbi:MAG: LytTR family DNA-binding domain-containing protein [candidate division KSB1 bacterium]
MRQYRALLVDDEPLAREVLRAWLKPHAEIIVQSEAANGREAVALAQRQQPDLLFLDVQMPELDGFGVLRELAAKRLPVIIFVTAYEQFAVRAFEVHALDYLLKPFTQARFEQALQRALQQLEHAQTDALEQRLRNLLTEDLHGNRRKLDNADAPAATYVDRLAIKTEGKVLLLHTADVDWIETAGDYVCVHVARKTYLLHESLNRLIARLDPRRFLRIHRSTAVNVDRIAELHPHFNGEYFILLHDGTKLKLSRTYRASLQALLGSAL